MVVEYTLGDRTRIDEDSRRELLVVEQPFANHNGGQLAFGPDGFLYIGPRRRRRRAATRSATARTPPTLLGTILRIDPEGGTEDGPGLRHPAGQPFADGEDGRARDLALRRCATRGASASTRRPATSGSADVGQNEFEEIDRLPADGGFDAGRGANLGWDEMEGTQPFEGGENPDGRRAADLRVRPRRGLLGHRRLRVPRRGDPGSRAPTSSPTTAAPACAASRSTAAR